MIMTTASRRARSPETPSTATAFSLTRLDGPDAVRNGSKSKKRPPTAARLARWRGRLRPRQVQVQDAESHHIMRRVVRRDLLHLLPFDAIHLHAVRDAHDDVLHDLGALGDGAAHFLACVSVNRGAWPTPRPLPPDLLFLRQGT